MNPPRPPSLRPVTEEPAPGPVPCRIHPGWAEAHPWLVQGITERGSGQPEWDMGLFGGAPPRDGRPRWDALREVTGATTVVHARQVHGPAVRHHLETTPGFLLADPCDGHLTRTPGVLLTVSVADCVPVTLVHERARAVAVLHAGWRGTAAGVVEEGVRAFRDRLGVGPDELEAHLGPAICGGCYEVGPEVHRALGEPVPPSPAPVDLRAVLAKRLVALGVDPARSSVSTWCTRCGTSPFFSHRGGDGGRQMSFVGIR